MTCLSGGIFGIFRLTLQVIILLIAIFDLVADWIVFRHFYVHNEGGQTTNALLAFLIIASLLFILEVRNAVEAIKIFKKHLLADLEGWEDGEVEEGAENKRPPSVSVDTDAEEKSLNSWQETVSFMLLAWEDLPVTIILYFAFDSGSCELFLALFDGGVIANLSLLGTFVSAGWKLLLSFFFCLGKCVTCQKMKGCQKETCCCCCRICRPILALLLMAFSGYLYFQFNEESRNERYECFTRE